MSTGSVVMMLVYGIVLFSQSLRFGLGNGVSRRTVFLSFLAFFGIFSVCMTVGDVLLQLLVSLFTDNSTDVLLLLFGHEHSLQLTTRLSLMGCLLAAHLAFGMIGYFIGGAYYRMGKYLAPGGVHRGAGLPVRRPAHPGDAAPGGGPKGDFRRDNGRRGFPAALAPPSWARGC